MSGIVLEVSCDCFGILICDEMDFVGVPSFICGPVCAFIYYTVMFCSYR
jgi:hypothetical protein